MTLGARSESIVVLVLVCAGAGRVEARAAKSVDPLCQRVLPAEVASRLSGRNDLELVPRLSITAAGGTCNYATQGKKKMVFLVTVLTETHDAAGAYARLKGQTPYLPHQAEVAGLGEAAFSGGDAEHLLVVRKGNQIVTLSSMLAVDGASGQMQAMVPRAQLIALARELVSKL